MRNLSTQVEGLTLSALSAGRPDRPALVLLHGWPHCNALYRPVIETLGQRFFVLAFDLPAIGGSCGAPASAQKSVLADVVLSAAEQLQAKSIVICGIDIGGMIAYAAARDHGTRICGAVTCNTVVPGIDPWAALLANPHIWHFAFHKIADLPEALVAGRQRAYFDYFFDLLAGRREAVTDAVREEFARAYARPESLKAGFDWYRALDADAEHNAQPKRFDTPLLYLRGDADGRTANEYVQPLRQGGAQNVQGEQIHGAGEFLPLEVPEAFVASLERFGAQLND